MVHPKPPTQLNQGLKHIHNKEGINMDTTTQAGHDSGALHPSKPYQGYVWWRPC